MTSNRQGSPRVRYRVWLARYADWQPKRPEDVPPAVVTLEPAERGTFSARAAMRYVRAFNRAVLERPNGTIWAVAVPVGVQYHGDALPGQNLVPPARIKNPLCVC